MSDVLWLSCLRTPQTLMGDAVGVQACLGGEGGVWWQLHSSQGAGGTLPGLDSKPSLFGENASW